MNPFQILQFDQGSTSRFHFQNLQSSSDEGWPMQPMQQHLLVNTPFADGGLTLSEQTNISLEFTRNTSFLLFNRIPPVQYQQFPTYAEYPTKSIVETPIQKRKKPRDSTSRFRGVSWHRRDKRWLARAWVEGRVENVGSFKTEIDAAIAVETRYIQVYGIDGASDLAKLLPFPLACETSTPTSLSEAILRLKTASIFIHSNAHKENTDEKPVVRSRKRSSGSLAPVF